jgi:hypothetical protein
VSNYDHSLTLPCVESRTLFGDLVTCFMSVLQKWDHDASGNKGVPVDFKCDFSASASGDGSFTACKGTAYYWFHGTAIRNATSGVTVGRCLEFTPSRFPQPSAKVAHPGCTNPQAQIQAGIYSARVMLCLVRGNRDRESSNATRHCKPLCHLDWPF